ncbi:uncharacterized protein LOC106152849 [Lingula anatina]|uniref:Uncharacterized protein LOC106152849 n=1 Tax=Lingula anatina TaxID=7574 RepID=A0A2R2MTY1_LINAN|nr:uncharacterized protein LOC106152849 [Lingula anatina]|eukprot:XP_023933704.1 uncharacterized protein LOC106152849 [Lingula anatina]
MNDPPLNQTYRHLENLLAWSQDFRIGPDSSPSQYRTREAGDYTNMKVKVLFKGVDFDSQLMRSLSLRDQLKQELYTLVSSHMAQEVAQTVDDVWIRGNYISFSVNKTTTGQANLLSSEAAKLKAVVDQGVVNVKVSGLTLQAEDVVVEGSFEDLCPQPCSPQNGTTEMICDGRPHCHWCYLDNQPYCGDDCLLQERFSDISVFLPCLPDTLTPADEQELLQDFRSKILAIAPVTEKGIQNLTLQGQTIHFAIQAALKGLSIADARQKIQNLLAMTNFKLGTKQEPGAFTVSAADDYTNAVFTLILNGVDFDQLLARSHSLRKDIMAELEKQLTSYFSAAVVRSLGHLSLHGNNLTFALSKPKNLTSINLKSEAEAFFRAIDSGKVKAIVAGNEVKVIGKTKTFSFESMCDQECSTSTQHATCVSKPGCGWCTVGEGPYCGDNCYLTERLPYQAFIPCNRTMKFNAAEIREVERNFRADLVRCFHPALTDKNIPEVTVNEEGVRFVLQGSMQVSDLSPYNKTVLDAMFSVAGRFYVGPDGKTDIPTRNKDDFTDVLMTMEFQGEDILSFHTEIIQGLKTFFSSELPAEVMSTFTVTDIQGDTITFTFYKAERSTVNLVSMAERLVQQQNSGGSLRVALANGHSLTPSRVTYTVDYHSLCSGPRPAIIFTTTLSPLTTELPSNQTNGTSTGIKNVANSTPPNVPTTVMVDSTTAGNNVSTASIVFRSTSVPSSAPPGVTTIPGMPNITTATTSTKDTGISGKSTDGVKTTLHSSKLPTSGTTVSSLTGKTSSGGLNNVSSAATSGVTMTTKMGGASTGSGQSTVSMSSVSVSVTPSLGVNVGGNSNGGQGTTTMGTKSSPDSLAKTTPGNMVSSTASSAVNSQQTTQSRVTTGTSTNSTATPPGIQTSLANTYSSVDSKTTPSPTGIKPQINVIPGKPGVGGTTPGQVTVQISKSSAAPTSALLPTSLPPSGTCAPSITIYYNGTPEALNEIIDVLNNRTNCSEVDVKNARAGLVVPPVTPLPSVNPMGPEKQILTNEKTDTDTHSSQKVGLGLGIPLGILGTLAALGLLGNDIAVENNLTQDA